MAASITLHKFGIIPDDDDTHVFTFIFENPARLLEQKSVESSEVNYCGQRWSVVLMRKEEKFAGIYLKWKYSDGQSASCVSCKASFGLSVVHRMDYARTKTFSSTQKFSTSTSLLGRGKFLQLSEMLDLGSGFMDETGRRLVVELSLSKCSTRFEKLIDTSPRARIKKNASGFYFDTNTFLLANNRWYLRVYPAKANSGGLPAVYLYLQSKSRGLSFQARFRLYVENDITDLLTNHFGDGSKFDGFGKTLSERLHQPDKICQLTVGVELNSVNIYKNVPLTLHSKAVYSPHLYNNYGHTSPGLAPSEAFQDQEGNLWKAEIIPESKILTVTLDKGVHHYQTNKTKLLCWSGMLLARDSKGGGVDIPMCGDPIVGYFSNFIDEKGYKMTFTIDTAELDERGSPYLDASGQIVIRFDLVTLQTLPIGMKSVPRFDFQLKHLLRARRLLTEREKTLADLRDEAASRASLNFDGSRLGDFSETGSEHGSAYPMYKSFESLDGLGGNDSIVNGHVTGGDDEASKSFISDLLHQVASLSVSDRTHSPSPDDVGTSRNIFNGVREDLSTESGITMSDESSLLVDARPNAVDVNKQQESIRVLTKFLQMRLPMRVSEIVEFGSMGTGTVTRSRQDVDLVVFSQDLPRDNQSLWMPSLLQAVKSFLQNAANYQDSYIPVPKCADFHVTPSALQFSCGGVDVDVMFSFDWESEERGGITNLHQLSCTEKSRLQRHWYGIGSSKQRKLFIADQTNEVKEIIKVVKHWRNCIQWKKTQYRPNSYLLSLLVIKSVEDTATTDIKTVLQRFGALVLAPELSIYWNNNYNPDKYPTEFEPPTPLILDPANPGYNVAASVTYWGQFRSEVINWLRGLGITVCNIPT